MNNQFSISKNGIFLNNKRIKMLESDFTAIQHKYSTDSNSNGNCAIFYFNNPSESPFIYHMEIWLTKDKQPLTNADLEKIEQLHASIGFNFNHVLKINTNLHLTFTEEHEPTVPSGLEYIDYDCTFWKDTKIGLRCLSLIKNSVMENEKYMQKLNNSKFNQLIKAIYDENIEQLEKLINEGADINFFECNTLITPLKCALIAKKSKACKLLINEGAEYDIFKIIKNPEQLEFILNCGVNPNIGVHKNLFNPLMYAVSQNNIKAAKILLDHGANVNAVTAANGTALRIAVIMKNVEMAALLIEYGADVNFITDGTTNLRAALEDEKPSKELVRLLSLYGGKINIGEGYADFYLTEDLEAVVNFIRLINLIKE